MMTVNVRASVCTPVYPCVQFDWYVWTLFKSGSYMV